MQRRVLLVVSATTQAVDPFAQTSPRQDYRVLRDAGIAPKAGSRSTIRSLSCRMGSAWARQPYYTRAADVDPVV
jgi:hypothetical protein